TCPRRWPRFEVLNRRRKPPTVVIPGTERSEGALRNDDGYCLAAERLGVLLGPEPHQQLAADIEHRTLDHRRLREHQRDGLLLVSPSLSLSGSLRNVVPARLSSVSHPLARAQRSTVPRSTPALL